MCSEEILYVFKINNRYRSSRHKISDGAPETYRPTIVNTLYILRSKVAHGLEIISLACIYRLHLLSF